MNIEEVASKCITGGCEYLDIQDKLMVHKEEVNLIVLIGLILLAIAAIWFRKKNQIWGDNQLKKTI